MATPADTYQEDPIIYSIAIREMALNRSPMTLLNSGSENAIIVLENILLQSKKVNMFAGKFNEEVCEDKTRRFEKALKYFLLNDGKISIILNEYDDETEHNSNILSILKQYSASAKYRVNISVKTTNERPIINGNEVHYTVGDESMYRLEYDTKNFHSQFCFNDIVTSKKLNEKFNESFKIATPLELRSIMVFT